MDGFTDWLPGSIPTAGSTDPGTLSPGATDWTQVLITGLSTFGNVKIAEANAQAHAPINYRASGLTARPVDYGGVMAGGMLPLLIVGVVLFLALKD